jgi:hypothetical protein
MKYILRLFLIIWTAIAVSGCSAIANKKDMKTVGILCANFSRSPHKTLLTPDTKKSLDRLVDGGGVPEDIKQAYDDYYAKEPLDGAEDFSDARRGRLDYHQNLVLKACHTEGWSEN